MTEQERFEATIAEKTPAALLRNARRIAGRRHKRKPNWVLAMDIYGVGSTFAWMLCVQNGIDADATS